MMGLMNNPYDPIEQREDYLRVMREGFERLVVEVGIPVRLDKCYKEIDGKKHFMGYVNHNTSNLFSLFSTAYQHQNTVNIREKGQ